MQNIGVEVSVLWKLNSFQSVVQSIKSLPI